MKKFEGQQFVSVKFKYLHEDLKEKIYRYDSRQPAGRIIEG